MVFPILTSLFNATPKTADQAGNQPPFFPIKDKPLKDELKYGQAGIGPKLLLTAIIHSPIHTVLAPSLVVACSIIRHLIQNIGHLNIIREPPMVTRMLRHTLISVVIVGVLAGGFTVMFGHAISAPQNTHDDHDDD